MKILITINTWNRWELTQRTLDSVCNNHSNLSNILVVDDHSTEFGLFNVLTFPVMVCRPPEHLGVGQAQRFTFRTFMDLPYDFICLLSNDVQVAPGFDYQLWRLWTKHCTRNTCICGYRSTYWEPCETLEEVIKVKTTGGLGLFADRVSVADMLFRLPEPWEYKYDVNFSQAFHTIFNPKESLIEHIGANSDDDFTLHKKSLDMAVNFQGKPE